MDIFRNEGFLLFLAAALFIILVSIQLTLNKILKLLQEIRKEKQRNNLL